MSGAPARDRKNGASSGRKMSNAPTIRADSEIAGYEMADLTGNSAVVMSIAI